MSVTDKRQRFQSIKDALVQSRKVLLFEATTRKVQMHREQMLTIEPCIELAEVE